MLALIDRLEAGVEAFNRAVSFLLEWLCIGLLAILAVIVVASVFWRYVLNDAISWSEEVSKFLMVWMTFAAAPIGLKKGAHVAVEMGINLTKGRLHQFLLLLIALAIIALMYVFMAEGWFLTQNARIQRAFTVDVSIFWVYVSMPVGSFFVATVALEFLLDAVRGLIDPALARRQPSGQILSAQ